MKVESIPPNEQLEAVLSNSLWSLKNRYFSNEWDAVPRLKKLWTVSLEQVVSEAKNRGLSSFVQESPGGDGVYLLRHEKGYEVRYMERATNIHGKYFDQLEPAFHLWVVDVMSSYGLTDAR